MLVMGENATLQIGCLKEHLHAGLSFVIHSWNWCSSVPRDYLLLALLIATSEEGCSGE